ncbi:MAG: hypothetical protein LBR80_06280 [Deltaproteobacteria bacterium]|nr:hypothetical protein [Deltaproteobacteria bacterium]
MPDHSVDGTAPDVGGRLPDPDVPRERDLKEETMVLSILRERINAIEARLDRLATKEDLNRFATKEDLDRFATKEALENLGKLLEAANKSAEVRFGVQAQSLADMREVLRGEIRGNERSIGILEQKIVDLDKKIVDLDKKFDEKSTSLDKKFDDKFDNMVTNSRWVGGVVAALVVASIVRSFF